MRKAGQRVNFQYINDTTPQNTQIHKTTFHVSYLSWEGSGHGVIKTGGNKVVKKRPHFNNDNWLRIKKSEPCNSMTDAENELTKNKLT